ncbi:MAG: ORF6N domain-containing protein [Elusimicrobia bacterium]|nr:ORF6N domain-containing protein [Elusimicrobiota bacterium]
MTKTDLITPIENQILTIRGVNVMLDSDLAAMYRVPTKVLNQAVKRNLTRFPADFMFRLSKEEWQDLRSQNVTFKSDIRKYPPYAFTEQGVAMLSSVLKSSTAVAVNIQIMRVFVRVRQLALEKNKQIDVATLKQALLMHIRDTKKQFLQTQEQINSIVDIINEMLERDEPNTQRKIGFK